MKQKEVYKKLVDEVQRLYNPVKEQIPQFVMGVYELYIAPHLERLPLTKADKGYIPTPLQEALSNNEVLLQTTKVIALMEASDNLEEFKALAEKKKERKKKEKPYVLTDFDKILSAMMAVPNADLKKQRKEKKLKK